DVGGFSDYIAAIPAHIARHDGRYIVQGVEPTCIEGDWRPQRMVIIEFPERSKAEAFLSDPSIQDLFKVRHQTTTSKLVLVDGCRWMPKPYRRAAVVSDYPELAAWQHASSNVHRSGCATANGSLVSVGGS